MGAVSAAPTVVKKEVRRLRFLPNDVETADGIRRLADTVSRAGGRLYLVGGSVRDVLMLRPPHDFDLCVAGLAASDVAHLISGARVSGAQFPVFRAAIGTMVCEIALARREIKVGEGRRGFEVLTGPEVNIVEDLRRRDLTVNAMAYDPLCDQVVDPFGGQRDIAQRRLRAVSLAFKEDPLRVYRTARFAATLGFGADRATIAMMRDLVPDLASLSVERVVGEYDRAMASRHLDRFFRTLVQADALQVHFTEIDALRGVPQPEQYHPEGDAFEHTMQVLTAAAVMSRSPEVLFGALVHDLGKALTPAEDLPFHPGHDGRGVEAVKTLSRRLGFSAQRERSGVVAARRHMAVHRVLEMRGTKVVDMLVEAARSRLGVEGLAIVAEADAIGRGSQCRVTGALGVLTALDRARRSIRGQDIKAPAGRKFGEALRGAQGKAVAMAQRELLNADAKRGGAA